MSADKDNEYFSDGIAEEILNALAQVEGPARWPGARRRSSSRARNESLATIGQALGVAHVLEGSVRKQGDKVRITAQLIRVQDGFHLWSETYDGDLSDVFALQERIAQAIASKLQLTLSGTAGATAGGYRHQQPGRLRAVPARVLDLRPSRRRAHAGRGQAAAGGGRARSGLCPRLLAPGGVALRSCRPMRPATLRTGSSRCAAMPGARSNSTRASPSHGRRWGCRAPLSGGGLIEARQHFEKALQLDPDDITTNFWFGLTLVRSGYNRAGVERIEHALAVDPMVPNLMRWRGVLYLRDGDIADAEQFLKRASATGLRLAGRELGEIEFRRGATEEAKRIWADGSRSDAQSTVAGCAGGAGRWFVWWRCQRSRARRRGDRCLPGIGSGIRVRHDGAVAGAARPRARRRWSSNARV